MSEMNIQEQICANLKDEKDRELALAAYRAAIRVILSSFYSVVLYKSIDGVWYWSAMNSLNGKSLRRNGKTYAGDRVEKWFIVGEKF